MELEIKKVKKEVVVKCRTGAVPSRSPMLLKTPYFTLRCQLLFGYFFYVFFLFIPVNSYNLLGYFYTNGKYDFSFLSKNEKYDFFFFKKNYNFSGCINLIPAF